MSRTFLLPCDHKISINSNSRLPSVSDSPEELRRERRCWKKRIKRSPPGRCRNWEIVGSHGEKLKEKSGNRPNGSRASNFRPTPVFYAWDAPKLLLVTVIYREAKPASVAVEISKLLALV